jgi:hypothetical protein
MNYQRAKIIPSIIVDTKAGGLNLLMGSDRSSTGKLVYSFGRYQVCRVVFAGDVAKEAFYESLLSTESEVMVG